MDRAEQLARQLASEMMADGFDGFESDFSDHLNKRLASKGVRSKRPARMTENVREVIKSRQKPIIKPTTKQESTMKINNDQPKPNGSQFSCQVTRIGASIAQPLPFALFGAQHFLAGYSNVINTPAGLSFELRAGIIGAAGLAVDFRYTSGGDTDIVRVTTSSAASYPAFLMASIADKFNISRIRYSISDSAQLGQLSQGLEVRDVSLFGKVDSNEISPDFFKDPRQFQSGIIDVPLSISIDKEVSIVSDIIAVNNFSISLNFSVNRFKS